MREVSALGYAVVSAADVGQWSEFAQHALGLQVASAPEGGTERETLFLRQDERSWRLAVEKGEDNKLVALGFEVPDQAALHSLTSRIESAGHAVKDAPDLAAQRRVTEVRQVTDPSGTPLEFFYGATNDPAPFESPTGAHFVTGAQGLGHAVVYVSDLDESTSFYVDLLGFRLTDVITLGGGLFQLYFTSPNARHHSLAYGLPRPDASPGQLQHIMLEVDDLDVVGRALDYCMDHDLTLRAMLGKHSNDHMVSFYGDSPSGLTIEYGFGGRQIDDAKHETEYLETASFWGHRPPDGRSMEEEIRKYVESMQSGTAPPD